MKVTVLVEGAGNDNKALRIRCRKAFRSFFEKAGLAGRLPTTVPCGGRNAAYDRFCTALANAAVNEFVILLVDSEDTVPSATDPWQHLRTRDRWQKPQGATDDQAHLMVQCMESWFLADRDALARYFGADFQGTRLAANPQPEQISKQDVLDGLRQAARGTKKGEYRKGSHSFDILGQLDPSAVRGACPHADRLLNTLDSRCA